MPRGLLGTEGLLCEPDIKPNSRYRSAVDTTGYSFQNWISSELKKGAEKPNQLARQEKVCAKVKSGFHTKFRLRKRRNHVTEFFGAQFNHLSHLSTTLLIAFSRPILPATLGAFHNITHRL